jgi:hypothetical protein
MSKMARNNPKVSPEVAVELVNLARQMRRLVYGGDGVPEWGTKFSLIEAEALEVGRELSRLMMEQAVGEQSQRVPSSTLEAADSGETAAVIGAEPSVLETTAGEVQWKQPKTRLSKARRDFFPSGPGTGR